MLCHTSCDAALSYSGTSGSVNSWPDTPIHVNLHRRAGTGHGAGPTGHREFDSRFGSLGQNLGVDRLYRRSCFSRTVGVSVRVSRLGGGQHVDHGR